MSKVIKDLLINEYDARFDGVDEAVLVDIRQMDAGMNTSFRAGLRKSGVKVTVIRNRLARQSFSESPLKVLGPCLTGPSALVYGGDTVIDVARQVVEFAKTAKNKMELKGAVLDGELYEGKAGVEALSKFPTKDEAIGQVVQLVLSPAASLSGAIVGPGGAIAGLLKAIEEKLEKGETIAKAG
jgi:large subunit ribosomal protein L10